MLKIISLIFMTSYSLSIVAGDIYRYVDPNTGQVKYSNIPVQGAEKITTEPMMIYAPPSYERQQRSVPNPSGQQQIPEQQAKKDKKYQHFSIQSPAHDQAFYATSNQFNVSLNLKPALQEGHYIRIYMDGKLVVDRANTSATVSNFNRGTHTLSAKVFNKKNQVVKSAKPITIHILKHHI